MVIEMSGDRVSQSHNYPAAESDGNSRPTAAPDSTYKVREEPLGSPKHARIVCVGAGASGINLIRTLRNNLVNYEVAVYEKNADVGGTWFENRYPGCRCDVPSHNYQFTWRPNHEWTNFFSPAEEIGAYLCRICDEEKMRDTIKTLHKVVRAEWFEDAGRWELKIEDLKTGEIIDDYANFLINGSGILNKWNIPSIPNAESFKGQVMHTSNWPKDFDYKDKVVVVVGNGASGIQVLPAIQPDVKKLYHIVRTPTWIIPPWIQTMMMLGKGGDALKNLEIDAEENFLPSMIEKFKTSDEFYRAFVKAIEKGISSTFPVVIKDGPVQAFARAKATEYMTVMMNGDKKLCSELIPDFPIGARRLTPAPKYLRALTQPNVEVIRGEIKQFVEDGIETTTGDVLKVDAVIFATGFDVSFAPGFPLVGREGNLQDSWSKEVPKAYMSCAVAGIPNYFTFLGPNAPIGHGSVFTLTEHIAKYITGVIRKCQTEGIKAIAPSRAAVDDYFDHIQAFMPRTAWASPCKSWFKGHTEDGPVTALHPGSRLHFFHMLERFRGEDWEYVYDTPAQNRFYYLGNGFSTKELDPTFDSTWYLYASDEALY